MLQWAIWQPVMNAGPQGMTQELILFNIFITHQADDTEGTFSTFTDGNRLEVMTAISIWQSWQRQSRGTLRNLGCVTVEIPWSLMRSVETLCFGVRWHASAYITALQEKTWALL